MANNYFKFKQFVVYQNANIMPISTDACVLAALVNLPIPPSTILDIGTGTGVLGLMLAQKFEHAKITALDINAEAIAQANLNFTESKFANRLTTICTDVNSFVENYKFDFIICNPPYFKNSLLANNENINTAKHSTHLSLQQLAINLKRLLNNTGNFSIIIPFTRVAEFTEIAAENKLFINNIIQIQHKIHSPYLTSIINGCMFSKVAMQTQIFTLKNADDTYTTQALQALQPFYLNL